MVLGKPLRLISFWQLQTLGWVCFYAWTLLGSLPDLLKRSGALRENTELVGLLFLGSCVLYYILFAVGCCGVTLPGSRLNCALW